MKKQFYLSRHKVKPIETFERSSSSICLGCYIAEHHGSDINIRKGILELLQDGTLRVFSLRYPKGTGYLK